MPKKKQSKKLPVKPVFRVFCEGAKTEPLYIKGFINHFHSNKRTVILVEDTNKNTPVQLVNIAVESKKKGHEEDVIWVVFDRESEEKYPNELHSKARKKAKDNNIEIAISNVCFEYCILLHFLYTTSPYYSCSDLLKNSKLKNHIKGVGLNDYEKNLPLLFDKLKEMIPLAIKNAEKLKKYAISSSQRGKSAPHFLNPYVDVHEMFQDIQNFIDKRPSVRA